MRLRPLLVPALATLFATLGWLHWRTPWHLGVALVAAVLLALAALAPRRSAPLQRQLERLGFLFAAGFTWIVLGLVFLLVFVPGRLLLALSRRDPLRLRAAASRASFWEPLPPAAAPDRFRRLF